jgi:hypothetical protein
MLLFLVSAGIFRQSMGARNQVGIGLLYRPARLHSLAEPIPWNRFLGSIKVKKYQLRLNNSKSENIGKKKSNFLFTPHH